MSIDNIPLIAEVTYIPEPQVKTTSVKKALAATTLAALLGVGAFASSKLTGSDESFLSQ